MNKQTFDILKGRGYIYQATNEEKIKEMLNGEIQTFYLGIDPTADSLHIGHFFALTMVRRLQKMGHKAIVLVGGATALIGDPTGKSDLRAVLTKEEVRHNKKEVKELVKRFVDLDGDNPAIIVDNNDWISPYNYIDFMREVGIHFNVNKMLATDCYKNRLEKGGLTFLEMGYMLMQAYDFVHLNRNNSCMLQVGGSDQWANMVAGVELSRKMNFAEGKKDIGLETFTCPLLVKADGEKMGKTSSGTLWVSREKTTVYDFYQMFINSYDEDVERLLSFFSDIEMDEIKKMCTEDIVSAKKVMAFEVTKLVHGEEEAIKVKEASAEIFSQKGSSANMPNIDLDKSIVTSGVDIKDLMVRSELLSSKSEARRVIEQGGIKVNGESVTDVDLVIDEAFINDDSIILQKGKKVYLKINLK